MGSSLGAFPLIQDFAVGTGERIDALMRCAVWVWTVSLPVTVVNASDRNPFLQPEDMGCVFYN
ncbi:hypothetical protein G2W53_027707 [Senna tora]|uniref:Uncharacterized protein n=1 Tax=Senna tora TaxID=362788 RepID=A0A834THC3_9FABA|nr:hypothetical protein G2W53_027707 [Senna tora]